MTKTEILNWAKAMIPQGDQVAIGKFVTKLIEDGHLTVSPEPPTAQSYAKSASEEVFKPSNNDIMAMRYGGVGAHYIGPNTAGRLSDLRDLAKTHLENAFRLGSDHGVEIAFAVVERELPNYGIIREQIAKLKSTVFSGCIEIPF